MPPAGALDDRLDDTHDDTNDDTHASGRRKRLIERLGAVAASRGFPAPALPSLLSWVEIVLDLDRRVNLTAAKTLDEAVDVLALSALAVTRAVERAPSRVVDLGTGNGLPGVAAALAWPDAEVVLVERRRKKAFAVQEGLGRLGLSNAHAIACDGRELLAHRPHLAAAVDLVTVRAVGTLADAARVAAPWLAPGGRLAHWKGGGLAADELDGGRAEAARRGLVELDGLVFEDPAGPGHLVLYERPAGA